MTKIGGYEFVSEKNLDLALTHSSYSQQNYERLEFLGDSILDFVVGKYFYQNFDLKEGMLTKLRAHYVSEENLSKVFDKLKLNNLVKIGKSCKELTKSIKCDVVEAVLAAIYLDSNIDRCEKFILDNIFLEKIEEIEILDSKSKLQEYAQKIKQNVVYSLKEKQGQSHNPTFVVEATMANYTEIGTSFSKQMAEQLAAKKILEKINRE